MPEDNGVIACYCHALQDQQCSLSVASNGDVIAAVADRAAGASSTATPAVAVPTSIKPFGPSSASASAAFELKGSGWQALVEKQGTASIRVLQEDDFQPEVRRLTVVDSFCCKLVVQAWCSCKCMQHTGILYSTAAVYA